jgi:hypothetical protein
MSISLVEQSGKRLINGSDINVIIATVNGMLAGTTTGVYKGTFDGIVGGTTPAAGTFTALTASTGYNGIVGGGTPAAGSFTALSASTGYNGIVGGVTPAAGTFTALSATTGYNGIVGGVTPAAANFTTIGASGALTFSVAASGIVLKRGSNGKCGTFVCNGLTPVTVSNTSIAVTDTIVISLNTVGGTVGAVPAIQTITASTGFTVAGTAADSSTYNYTIISNAA